MARGIVMSSLCEHDMRARSDMKSNLQRTTERTDAAPVRTLILKHMPDWQGLTNSLFCSYEHSWFMPRCAAGLPKVTSGFWLAKK